MYSNLKMFYSPMGNAWNLFSAASFEGGSDPGVPGKDDNDNELPELDASAAADIEGEMNSADSSGEDSPLSFGRAVDPAKTK